MAAPAVIRNARRGPVAVAEFRLVPGKDTEKTYMLHIPPSIVKQFPTGFKPTVRLAGKYLIVAATPDTAKQVTELKAGDWKPSSSLAQAFDALPAKLVMLNVSDPRTGLPESLASLPGTIQKLVNTIGSLSQTPPPGTPPGGMAGVPGGQAGMMAGQGARTGSRPGGGAGPGAGLMGAATGGGVGGPPGGMGGMMAGGPPPGGEDSKTPSLANFRFNISASKLPKADDLRQQLFPACFALSSTDEEITFVTRESFPGMFDLSPKTAVLVALLLPAVQAAREAARRAAIKATGVDPGSFMPPGGAGAPPSGGADAGAKTEPPGGQPGGPPGAGVGSRPGGRRGGGRP